MGVPKHNFAGERHYKWLILDEYVAVEGKPHQWKAKCDCGTVKFMNPYDAVRGKSMSCGCNRNHSNLTSEQRREIAQKSRDSRLKYANYDGELGRVVEVLDTPKNSGKNPRIYKVKCSQCDGFHIYTAASLRNNSFTRKCTEYKTYNYSGLTKKEIHIRSHYGVTPEQHQALRELQNDSCAICNKDLEHERIDHDHDSGDVRGLLCQGCNSGLGLLGDNVEGLKRAIAYLENTPFSVIKENK